MHRTDVAATRVRDTLDALGLLEPVLRFKHGVDTILTADGKPLSESQCCILAVARAAVGHPGLLLVDGCLDGLGERDLDRCLAHLLSDDHPWTLIVATARDEIAERIGRTISLPETALRNPNTP